MAWRGVALPALCPARLAARLQERLPTPTSLPLGLLHLLSANALCADDDTTKNGNCGVDAVAIGLLRERRRLSASWSVHFNGLLTAAARVAQPRNDLVKNMRGRAVEWMQKHKDMEMWEGFTFRALCLAMSGSPSFEHYLGEMSQEHTWVDLPFMHALGHAFGVDICAFQEGQSPGIVGASLGNMGHSKLQHDPVCIPVALVNDYHFWAAVPTEPEEVEYVDKGDPVLDVVRTAPRSKRQRAVPHELESDSDGEDPRGLFQTPPSCRPGASTEQEIDRELALCQALRQWDPWRVPSEEVLDAMECLSRVQSGISTEPSAAVDRAFCRSAAIEALAHEEANFCKLPEHMKYQRAARCFLHAKGRANSRRFPGQKSTVVRDYLEAHASLVSPDALAQRLQHTCKEGHPCMILFTPQQVWNWRVLWMSMPAHTRREHVVTLY